MSHLATDPYFYDTATYAWVIDEDHLYTDTDGPDDFGTSEVGITGPSGAPTEMLERLAQGEGRKFKIYDDDGELYYTGRIYCAGGAQRELDSDDLFGPLEDFGKPNAGAVSIRYCVNGRWVTL